ncbi:MAG: metallophosphoesterase family protein, partial [Methanomassiliicoccales archaeon]
MRIVHISDPHLGHPGTVERFRARMDHLASLGPEAVVLTGDLVDNAFQASQLDLASEVLDSYRELRLLLVPGNHDYGNGRKGDKDLVGVFRDRFLEGRIFPLLDILEGVAFIGLDSMAKELNWHDRMWAEGELGKGQLRRLTSLLREEEVIACRKRVVYLHHHPFDYQPLHQLKDSGALHQVLDEAMMQGTSIDALLYGHHHVGRCSNGKWGILRCYDAGTVTMKPRSWWEKKLPWFRVLSNSARLIDLDAGPENDRLL